MLTFLLTINKLLGLFEKNMYVNNFSAVSVVGETEDMRTKLERVLGDLEAFKHER